MSLTDCLLRTEQEHGVLRITFARPDKRNALNEAMWSELDRILKPFERASKLRAVVLVGAGGHFSAGADIAELQLKLQDKVWMKRNHIAVQRAQQRVYRLPMPTIALIEGSCFGGGLGLASACDFRIAAPSARFSVTPARLGLAYSLLDMRRLVDLVGPAVAREMLLLSAILDADEAKRCGLVTRLVGEDVIEAALADLLRSIADSSPRAIATIKLSLLKLADGQRFGDSATRAQFDALFDGPDFAEGAAAFMEKRMPRFDL